MRSSTKLQLLILSLIFGLSSSEFAYIKQNTHRVYFQFLPLKSYKTKSSLIHILNISLLFVITFIKNRRDIPINYFYTALFLTTNVRFSRLDCSRFSTYAQLYTANLTWKHLRQYFSSFILTDSSWMYV